MPKITVNNAEINYKLINSGKPETLVFSNSLVSKHDSGMGCGARRG